MQICWLAGSSSSKGREGSGIASSAYAPRTTLPACLPRVIGCSKRNSFFRHALPLGGERGLYARYRSSLDARVCVCVTLTGVLFSIVQFSKASCCCFYVHSLCNQIFKVHLGSVLIDRHDHLMFKICYVKDDTRNMP